MAYDISDDDLPHAIIIGLEAKGWRFNASVQQWRLHNNTKEFFSPHAADHLRQWTTDVDAVVDAMTANALTILDRSQGDQMSSTQVVENNTNLLVMAKTLFTADAAKTGYSKSWDDAPEGMRQHFIRLAAKKLDTTPAASDHPVIEPTGGDLKSADGTGYHNDTREDLKPMDDPSYDF